MNVIEHYPIYIGKGYKPSLKQAIKEKMRVLSEFFVVNEKNEREIENMLKQAVAAAPHRDYEVVLDHIARKLIFEKLNRGE